ncbi:MAG: hypothetical protein KKB00_12575 [Gammaproteobacteria bacterium]|nr:hypothetical protein [Gammaproteobacteria bacterium]
MKFNDYFFDVEIWFLSSLVSNCVTADCGVQAALKLGSEQVREKASLETIQNSCRQQCECSHRYSLNGAVVSTLIMKKVRLNET